MSTDNFLSLFCALPGSKTAFLRRRKIRLFVILLLSLFAVGCVKQPGRDALAISFVSFKIAGQSGDSIRGKLLLNLSNGSKHTFNLKILPSDLLFGQKRVGQIQQKKKIKVKKRETTQFALDMVVNKSDLISSAMGSVLLGGKLQMGIQGKLVVSRMLFFRKKIAFEESRTLDPRMLSSLIGNPALFQ